MAVAEELGLSNRHYELQTLAGMGDPLKTALVELNQCVRVYCPYGDLIQGMAYLIRRLLENTSNDSFLKQGFGDRGSYDRLLENPVVARPPSAPLPKRHYQDIFEDYSMPAFVNAVNTGFGSSARRAQMRQAIASARASYGASVPLMVGGESIDTGEWFNSTNPAHPSEIVAAVAKADTTHADRAVASAAKAFADWSRESPARRADVVRRAGELLEQRRLELAALLVLEVGKTWREADAEVTEAIDYCNYHAALAETMGARPRRRNVPGEDNVLIYDPCGVCALITPWDFPLALLAGMVSAAVVVGNTCVVKPSSNAPVSAARLVEIMHGAGVPQGVLNYLPGDGAFVGRHLVEHSAVHLVAFCGSRSVGLETAAAAARVAPGQRHMKRSIIDTGAKNAIIIDHDVDLDDAVGGVIGSAFAYSGQKCTACSRVIVVAGVYEKFCEKIAEAAKTMKIGDPAEAGTLVGPVIDADAVASIGRYVTEGKKTYRLLFEAPADQLPSDGHYVAPVILADVNPKSPLAQEEIFGPVLAVIKAQDFDEALNQANDSMYALTGGVYSRSPSHIERARWEFKVGNLYINRKITGSQVDVQPYGGSKLSGDGARLGGPDYLLQYCRPRTISENTLRHGLTPSEETTSSVGD
jgi:RHH-type proline utilization regulon transcriptional repressor/proline dehydrogenase/delta 1-pyrroline-5-carboxylate dehydrogenase